MNYYDYFAIAVFVAGLLIGIYWLYIHYKTVMAKVLWRKNIAIVKKIEIKTEKDEEWGDRYHPNINYEYSIDAQNYSGSKYLFNDDSGFSKKYLLQNQVYEIKVGEEIIIFYDPKHPKKSVVNTNLAPGGTFKLVACMLMCLFSSIYLTGWL